MICFGESVAGLMLAKEVCLELTRQEEIWGEQNHDNPYWMTILVEEVGEAAQAVLAPAHNSNPNTTRPHDENLRTELIQVAAVALNWIHNLDRQGETTQ